MKVILSEMQLDFKDILIKPQQSNLSSRSQVKLVERYSFKHSPLVYQGIPLIVANMDTTGTISAAIKMSKKECMVALHKHYSVDELVKFFKAPKTKEEKELFNSNKYHTQHTFYSMGIVNHDYEKFKQVAKSVGVANPDGTGIRMICIDVANGYMDVFVQFCKKIRTEFPKVIIMAGNVVCASATKELIEAGVDIVKVGIGSGSVCQTRVVAGVGRPQFSAIVDCQDMAESMNAYVVSDGGVTCIADFSKAFGICWGVMSGGQFSGHDESERAIIEHGGQKFVEFYGMSSNEAMDKHNGGRDSYKASEGKRVLIPYKGSIDNTTDNILGGIRSAHTYIGASNLNEFRKNIKFYRVSQEVNEIFGSSK